MSDIPFKNPGWAGNTGEYDLTEDQVRGVDFVGIRPLEGGHPAGSATYPYMLDEKDPEAHLFEGPYEARFEKIVTRYPTRQAALLPSLNLAQACLVLCYEIHLAGSEDTALPRGKRDQGPATQKDLEEMYSALHRGLSRIDFFKGDRHPESVMRLLRTILSRAEPDLREARLVRARGFEMERYFDREGAESEPDT